MTLNRRSFNAAAVSLVALNSRASWGADPSQVPTHQEAFALRARGCRIPVIFDTDIGSDIDDTWALLYLLKCPELDIRLIATDSGKGDYRAALTAKFLTSVGKSDIPIAISIGDRSGSQHQAGWLGDYQHASYPGEILEDAPAAIIEAIHRSPEPVTVICVGTVPNIAEALRRDPTICQNARFVGMHGAIHVGYGGQPPVVAEANVRGGIEPLRATFAAPWECSITPLDTCGIVELGGDRYQQILHSGAVGIEPLMANYKDWLTRVPWLSVKPDPLLKSSTLFDLVAVSMAFSEQWLTMETLPLSITDSGITEIDAEAGRPIRCALKWTDLETYKDHLVERLIGDIA